MPARLAAFLALVEPGRTCEVLAYEPMTGGYSRSMAKARVAWSDGVEELLVLRGDPPPGQALFDTDRETEWSTLRGLTAEGTVAMPAARWYDATGEHLGTKAIILDWCGGPSLRALLDDGADRSTARDDLVDALARIHTVDPASVGVPVPDDPAAYLDELLSRWTLTERAHPDSVPVLRFLGAWLRSHRPPPTPLVLCHGDYQASNLLVADGSIQVIDWEFAHVGDPREDLGYYNVYSAAAPPNLFELDPAAFCERYRERTGTTEEAVNPVTVAYFTAVAAIQVYTGILGASAAMAAGLMGSTMVTFNLNAMAVGHDNFLTVCQALDGLMGAAATVEATR